ncbi:C39 family peptidase [Paenibacillus profundus]|uniref:C39 family peptidase n=1 Tax=Paenibacillus profundus TaxID=1173085 RepID=A0ABS8YG35_9BACL|nr:C39 family peptidase [Paenibacillus profundus]MCE5170953.1 C39 family peptidase [Paenibacillus profundus]
MPQFVRRLNRWLLFLILLALCAYPFQYLLGSKFDRGALSFMFDMPSDDIVLMLYSNTARVGRYLVPIDDERPGAAPYKERGETFVPARFLANKLEAELSYDKKRGTITFAKDKSKVTYSFHAGEVTIATAAAPSTTPLKAAPLVKDGMTYVPLRPVTEALGRSIYTQDGIIALSKRKSAPDAEQWQDWHDELSLYLAYDSFGSYAVKLGDTVQTLFRRWEDAVAYAKQAPGRRVTYRGEHVMWDPERPAPKSIRLNGAPLILQLPDLPRGCEVTALAMLLRSAQVDVDKNELAEKIRKDPTPYKRADGKIYFGNPHNGFVGDMRSLSNPGLGVYHEPIADLAEKYLPGRIIDMTGTTFDHLLWVVGQGTPVWVIHTTMYDAVPERYWVTWQTADGPIQVTYYEHSLVVTGYDDKYVYVNDPLGRRDRVERKAFQRGWEQMGSQAITYLPEQGAPASNPSTK